MTTDKRRHRHQCCCCIPRVSHSINNNNNTRVLQLKLFRLSFVLSFFSLLLLLARRRFSCTCVSGLVQQQLPISRGVGSDWFPSRSYFHASPPSFQRLSSSRVESSHHHHLKWRSRSFRPTAIVCCSSLLFFSSGRDDCRRLLSNL